MVRLFRNNQARNLTCHPKAGLTSASAYAGVRHVLYEPHSASWKKEEQTDPRLKNKRLSWSKNNRTGSTRIAIYCRLAGTR